jgi:agmatinase
MGGFPFESQNTFLRCEPLRPGLPFAVAGLPWDGGVTNRPGARLAPRSIRQASHMLCDGIHPYFQIGLDGQLGDAGDLPLPSTCLEAVQAALPDLLQPLLTRHHMVWLGGDHSLTLPLLRAYRAALGRPLAVLHFDAHPDTWSDHFGEPSGHGTWVHEAMQEDLVLPEVFTQIGIRSSGHRLASDYVHDRGGRSFSARDLRGLENESQLEPLLTSVRERWAAAGQPPLYLSLDIDCLDPAFAPGTGTPEPGGLSSNQVLTILEALSDLPFVGMDCMEVSPPYDHAELTSMAAAHFVWTYLCGQVSRRASRRAQALVHDMVSGRPRRSPQPPAHR